MDSAMNEQNEVVPRFIQIAGGPSPATPLFALDEAGAVWELVRGMGGEGALRIPIWRRVTVSVHQPQW